MTVRKATIDDDAVMVAFGRKFYCTLPYSDVEYCETSARRWLALMRDMGVLLIAEVGGEPVGMAGGIYSPFIFNDSYKVGAELMWWVEPEYRGCGIGGHLLMALEQASASAGCIRWSMIATAESPPEVDRMYHRAGYEPCERTYTKVPKWQQ